MLLPPVVSLPCGVLEADLHQPEILTFQQPEGRPPSVGQAGSSCQLTAIRQWPRLIAQRAAISGAIAAIAGARDGE